MPLSLSKLKELLTSKGYRMTKLFTLDKSLFLTEIYSSKTADTFYLYIPSKYTIDVKDKENVYKLKNISIENTENIADEYAEEPNLQNLYETNINLLPGKEGVETHLQNNYRQDIKLGDISRDDNEILKATYRQLKRLRYCVQNIPYKIAIQYSNYILPIRRDDSIDLYLIKNFSRDPSKRIFIIVDLETFYEKTDIISEDIKTVRESIYNVLERNQNNHGKMIEKIIENKKDILNIPTLAQVKKNSYDRLIKNLENMLIVVIEAEKNILDKLTLINHNIGEGLHNDINRVHEKSKLEKERENLADIKNNIIVLFDLLRKKKENTILIIDKIMFDNTIMFDTIVKNFSKLKEYC